MLNTQPKSFRKEGYCLFEEVLTSQEIETIRNELDKAIANLPKKQIIYKDGVDKEVDARPEYMVEPHPKNAFWLDVCRHPRVLDTVESLLGPDLILIMSHLIVKVPEDGLPVAWHQDNTYWHSVDGTDVVTVWLAIDDTDVSNGCMQVIPCTHEGYPEMEKVETGKDDLLGLTVEVTAEMLAAAVPLEMKAGSLSVHDSFVLHGSEANTSGRRRAAYTMRYANANTVTIDTKEHWVPVYLVRGQGGADEKQYVDARPGRTVPVTPS
ncbi:MAG: phytanoyl-CoA dioxygenase family protein [Planctomycetes bacterium]|nr:phytanoyl-CoA dioxygenase family protein [Planctomycetota bacterium]